MHLNPKFTKGTPTLPNKHLNKPPRHKQFAGISSLQEISFFIYCCCLDKINTNIYSAIDIDFLFYLGLIVNNI